MKRSAVDPPSDNSHRDKHARITPHMLPDVLLDHVVSFLSLVDIRIVLQVSRHFSRLRGRRSDTASRILRHVPTTTFSPWMTFVTMLILYDCYDEWNRTDFSRYLHHLRVYMPHIRHLSMTTQVPDLGDQELALPSNLQTFCFNFTYDDISQKSDITRLMNAIGQTNSMTSVELETSRTIFHDRNGKEAEDHACIPLNALEKLPCLTEIALGYAATSVQAVALPLRRMQSLRKVSIQQTSEVVVKALFASPLPWTDLSWIVGSPIQGVDLAAALPCLTTLDVNGLHLTEFVPLSPIVTTLTWTVWKGIPDYTMLVHFTRLHTLHIIGLNFPTNFKQLGQLTDLRTLHISYETDHLEFLRFVPQLTSLQLKHTAVVINGENLGCIASLTALRTLILHDAFDGNLGSEHTFGFQPPSRLLPNLVTLDVKR